MTKSRWSLLLGCRLSPRKKLQKWICNISTILFLLCMEYNYILKTIVGASSLRVAGEKRCFFFSFRPSPLQNAQVFQVFFFFSLTRCLIHFLNSSSPLRKRAGWWDRIFFAVNLVGRMKGQGKGMNNFFFPSLGTKRLVTVVVSLQTVQAQQKHFFFWTYDLWGKQS